MKIKERNIALIIGYFILPFLLPLNSSFSQSLDKYILAYWSFDDSTARDFSGNGYHGTIRNNPFPVPGVNGKTAFFFNGKNDYIQLGEDISQIGDFITIPPIDFPSLGEFTVSCWSKFNSMSAIGGDFLVDFGNHTYGWLGMGLHILQEPYIPDLYYTFSVGDKIGSLQTLRRQYQSADNDRWVFTLFTFAKDTIKAYFDTKLIGAQYQKLNVSDTTAGIACHWWWYAGEHRMSARMTAAIDEVMIFKKALNPCERIKAMMMGEGKKAELIVNKKSRPCESDTADLSPNMPFVSYKWSTGENTSFIRVTKSGKYFVEVIDKNGCIDTLFADVTLNSLVQPEISGKDSFCEGDSAVLSVTPGFESYDWSTGETTSSIIVKSPGIYTVTVRAKDGCLYLLYKEILVFPDLRNLTIDSENGVIDFDTLLVLGSKYLEVRIRNNSINDIRISNLPLKNNVYFSIPQSQFPLRINSGDSAIIRIYFSPNKMGKMFDTLEINNECGNAHLILKGICVENLYGSPSDCEVPIQFKTKSVSTNPYLTSSLSPNPSDGMLVLKISSPDRETLENIRISIFDILGQSYPAEIISNQISCPNNEYYISETEINSSMLPSGTYILQLGSEENVLNHLFIKE